MATPDDLPVINYERLAVVRAAMPDPAVLEGLIASYIDRMPNELRALGTSPVAEVQKLAHRLKSSSASIGGDRLAFLFGLLERHPSHDEKCRRLIEESTAEFMIFRAAFGRGTDP